MKKWEYKLYTVTGAREQDVILEFDEYGDEGWELVCFIPLDVNQHGRSVFKPPRVK